MRWRLIELYTCDSRHEFILIANHEMQNLDLDYCDVVGAGYMIYAEILG